MVHWSIGGSASVLIGGQFGSEGKGSAAAWLALNGVEKPDIATTAAGAQAGHTTQWASGRKFITYHMPTTAATVDGCMAYINAGAIINPDQLHREVIDCGLEPREVIIHPRAAVITPENLANEQQTESGPGAIASTRKGVGAAIADKIMRRAKLAGNYEELRREYDVRELNMNGELERNRAVVVEVPQGTDLSLNNSGFYPWTTSRDCYVTSGLHDAGIHPTFLGPTAMIVRTYPIRVGHITNEVGETIAGSGPFYPDSVELDWAKDFPGIEPEKTTVTKRVRRIASWSDEQYIHGLELNRPTIVVLTFCDYLHSIDSFLGKMRRMSRLEDHLGIDPHHVYAFGPNVDDMTDDAQKAMDWYDRRGW